MLAGAAAGAVLRPLAADARRAVDAVVAGRAVAAAEPALAVLRAVGGAAARLGAVEARPVEVALADAVRADAVVRALVRARGQLGAAVGAAPARLACYLIAM